MNFKILLRSLICLNNSNTFRIIEILTLTLKQNCIFFHGKFHIVCLVLTHILPLILTTMNTKILIGPKLHIEWLRLIVYNWYLCFTFTFCFLIVRLAWQETKWWILPYWILSSQSILHNYVKQSVQVIHSAIYHN